jgi:ubiquinone/menaquinone biosynthesis C-methylase UbiE
MLTIEREVARHYAHGSLEEAVRKGLQAMGRDPRQVEAADLAAIDEFHMGGRQATTDLASRLELRHGLSLLDVGCGIGGPARYFALEHGCRVTGVDVTPEYVEVATALTRVLGLSERPEFRVASALDLPFEDASFDRATLLHVGMNVPDKERLCVEVGRVVKPGGLFAVYDVMRVGEGDIVYPVAWADTEATSFVATPAEYRRALLDSGFDLVTERNRSDLALEFFHRMKARIEKSGPPPLGLHILMRRDAPAKVANMIANLEHGRIAPVEMICRLR